MPNPPELIDTYDRNNIYYISGPRAVIIPEIMRASLRDGDAPLAVKIVKATVINPHGLIYAVQRAQKSENPFLFTTTFGEHVKRRFGPDETRDYISRTLREGAKEEVDMEDIKIARDIHDYEKRSKRLDLSAQAIAYLAYSNHWSLSVRWSVVPAEQGDRLTIWRKR